MSKEWKCPFCGGKATWFDRKTITYLPDSKTRCGRCGRATDETEEPKPVSIRNVMKTLGITADVLFARIREDLERGLVREARAHLNFVDKMA
jgi:hypothetical protein